MTNPTCPGCGKPRAACDCVTLSQFAAELRAQAPAESTGPCPICNQFHGALSGQCQQAGAAATPDPLGFSYERMVQGEADAKAGRTVPLQDAMAQLRKSTPPPASARWEELIDDMLRAYLDEATRCGVELYDSTHGAGRVRCEAKRAALLGQVAQVAQPGGKMPRRVTVGCIDCGWTGRRTLRPTSPEYGACGQCGAVDLLVPIKFFRELDAAAHVNNEPIPGALIARTNG